MERDELDRRFDHHVPNATELRRHEDVRTAAKSLAEWIDRLCPESREKSLAVTKLEEAMFWANAAIARNEEN